MTLHISSKPPSFTVPWASVDDISSLFRPKKDGGVNHKCRGIEALCLLFLIDADGTRATTTKSHQPISRAKAYGKAKHGTSISNDNDGQRLIVEICRALGS